MAEPDCCRSCGLSMGDGDRRYTLRHGGVVCEACAYERRSSSAKYPVGPTASRPQGSTTGASSKNRRAAGLFAIFLGGLGIHKFYLGYTAPGLVFLLVNTVGWILTISVWGLPNVALQVIAIVEGLIYLTRTDEQFEQIYVVGRRPWF